MLLRSYHQNTCFCAIINLTGVLVEAGQHQKTQIPIDSHCKANVCIFWSLKNSPNLLKFLKVALVVFGLFKHWFQSKVLFSEKKPGVRYNRTRCKWGAVYTYKYKYIQMPWSPKLFQWWNLVMTFYEWSYSL